MDYPSSTDLGRLIKAANGLRTVKAVDPLDKYCPHKPFSNQERFLQLTTPEALYGGALGGGKSDALLMAALMYVHIPGYSALLLRRVGPSLRGASGLVDRASAWLSNKDCTWSERNGKWTFPSGATLAFGHIQYEKDKYQYQGQEYQFIGFDEVNEFTETQYTYMMTRLRKVLSMNVPLRVRCTTNPGGRRWVKERFVKNPHPSRPFIASSLDDNPYLEKELYEEQLKSLDSITYRQLRLGEWIDDGQGLIYPIPPRCLTPVIELPRDSQVVMGIDLGSSMSNPTTAWCIVAWHKHHPDMTWILESDSTVALSYDEMASLLRVKKAEWGVSRYVVDEGGLGALTSREMALRTGYFMAPAEKTNKKLFRRLFLSDLEKERILFQEGTNGKLIHECSVVEWDDEGKDTRKGMDDHITDAMLYAWRHCRSFASRVPEADDRTEEEKRKDEDIQNILSGQSKTRGKAII